MWIFKLPRMVRKRARKAPLDTYRRLWAQTPLKALLRTHFLDIEAQEWAQVLLVLVPDPKVKDTATPSYLLTHWNNPRLK